MGSRVQGPGSGVRGPGPRVPARVALTGGIATGKSRCLAAFAALGVPTIDADRIARDVVAPGTVGHQAVVRRFGPGVVGPDSALNRPALGALIFADPKARRDLEQIIHPAVYAAIERWYLGLDAHIGIADIPLLFETGHADDFDIIVVAACRPDQQIERLMARSGLTESGARTRIAAQLPLAEKVARADYVIDTSGSLEDTDANTRAVWQALQSHEGR